MSLALQGLRRGAGRSLSRPGRAALLLAGLALAMTLRVLAGGRTPAASTPAAALFGGLLLASALLSGWRPGRPRLGALLLGAVAGAALLAVAALRTPVPLHGVPALDPRITVWAPVVVLVAVAEEWLLRGALHDAIRPQGELLAALVGALAFALLHLPLYGVAALPLDLAVGLVLGGLRVLSGGVAAPAAAHSVADLGSWVLL